MPRVGLDPETVVAAAAELADADGLAQLTLARLATRLGVRTPSLYGHVGGLPDLRERLAARAAGELADRLSHAIAGRSGAQALRAMADAYRAYAREHPGLYTSIQRAPGADSALAPQAAELVQTLLAVLRGYGLEGDEAIHAARIVRSTLHGFVTLELDGGFGIPLSLDVTWKRLVAMLEDGLSGWSGGAAPHLPAGE